VKSQDQYSRHAAVIDGLATILPETEFRQILYVDSQTLRVNFTQPLFARVRGPKLMCMTRLSQINLNSPVILQHPHRFARRGRSR
jgi:hypothetical protein